MKRRSLEREWGHRDFQERGLGPDLEKRLGVGQGEVDIYVEAQGS